MITKPLTTLLEKDVPFGFNDACLNAFTLLKEKLTNSPILLSQDLSLLFELMSDASEFSIGTMLGERKGKYF